MVTKQRSGNWNTDAACWRLHRESVAKNPDERLNTTQQLEKLNLKYLRNASFHLHLSIGQLYFKCKFVRSQPLISSRTSGNYWMMLCESHFWLVLQKTASCISPGNMPAEQTFPARVERSTCGDDCVAGDGSETWMCCTWMACWV